jgi:flavin-dependent dehydrogenase
VTASAALLLYGAALCLYCAFAPTETLETPRMSKVFDAIVVGARCAGSPTAMLLARKGYRVLVVDRAAFPSDTLSTHILHPLGVSALSKWGLLERLAATGCPPIDTYAYDFGPVTLAGAPGTKAAPVGYCPRRTILDKLLVDAAVQSGAELCEDFAVDELLIEEGRVVGIKGGSITERARVVIGADGRHSFVAKALRPERYDEKPPLLRVLHLLERAADGRAIRDLHPSLARVRRRANP